MIVLYNNGRTCSFCLFMISHVVLSYLCPDFGSNFRHPHQHSIRISVKNLGTGLMTLSI